eukprot:SAG31_NODE_1210_length_9377_cov_21.101207_1_plen_402_part_00
MMLTLHLFVWPDGTHLSGTIPPSVSNLLRDSNREEVRLPTAITCGGNRVGNQAGTWWRCEFCPNGKYFVPTQGGVCLQCHAWDLCAGGQRLLTAATAEPCPAATQPDVSGERCVSCPAGKVRQSRDTTSLCNPCHSTMEPDINQTRCLCKVGHYIAKTAVARRGIRSEMTVRVSCLSRNAEWRPLATDTVTDAVGCIPCSSPAYHCVECAGGQKLPTPKAGYGSAELHNISTSIARVEPNGQLQLTFFECPDATDSAFGRNTGSMCLPGGNCAQGSTGPLCQVCELGYEKRKTRGREGPCEHCPTKLETLHAAVSVIGLIAAVFIVIIMLTCLCTRQRRNLAFKFGRSDITDNPLLWYGAGNDLTTGDTNLVDANDERTRTNLGQLKTLARVNLQVCTRNN